METYIINKHNEANNQIFWQETEEEKNIKLPFITFAETGPWKENWFC